jgi:hypothetical protein
MHDDINNACGYCEYIVMMIPIVSGLILTWDKLHWKDYLIIFSCIYRTSKMEPGCDLDVHFSMNITISQ